MIVRHIRRREVPQIPSAMSGFPLKLQQLLAARGVESAAELDYQLKGLLPPDGLKDLEKAVSLLLQAIELGQKILIIGDFDADGATSSALMIKALRAFGAKEVNYLVPDRFKFGYGLSVKLVEQASLQSPDLIVTVDNGIANNDGVRRANRLGIPVIITDHHLAPAKLPEAKAIVNPNQPMDEFPSKNLAGVGVAFYLLLALRAKMREIGWFESNNLQEPNLARFLDIVALGTVADVVPLDRNNRLLVEQGLKRIRNGQACPGINALLQLAQKDASRCQASDLGFAVGPRINAAGRLEDMSVGIECLLAENLDEALLIASELDLLNRSRKTIESSMLEAAESDLEAYFEHNKELEGKADRPAALCLFDPEWHQGVVGILASRLKEKINRPVIIFAQDQQEQQDRQNQSLNIKGSARSVKGVHIRDVLVAVSARFPHLIDKFGGHAMAAGLSLKLENFQAFAAAFCTAVEQHLDGETIKDEIVTDAGLTAAEMNLDFARELQSAGPWGQGFPEPLFDDEFLVETSRSLKGGHLKLQLEKDNQVLDGIYFRCPEAMLAQSGDRVRVVYRLDINHFRGSESLQLMIEQLQIL